MFLQCLLLLTFINIISQDRSYGARKVDEEQKKKADSS